MIVSTIHGPITH